MDVTCIILAGGRGERLGRDKVLEIVGDRSLLEHVVSCVTSLSSDIIIVTDAERSGTHFADNPKVKVVTDIYPGKGPLGGIYTGLATSASSYNLVVASDMPFLNQALLRYMIKLSPGFDVVVPRVGRLVEPLHAVYSKDCLPLIESMLREDRLSVYRLLGRAKVRYVEGAEIDRFDPGHLSFFNINTRADLARARELVKGKRINDKC